MTSLDIFMEGYSLYYSFMLSSLHAHSRMNNSSSTSLNSLVLSNNTDVSTNKMFLSNNQNNINRNENRNESMVLEQSISLSQSISNNNSNVFVDSSIFQQGINTQIEEKILNQFNINNNKSKQSKISISDHIGKFDSTFFRDLYQRNNKRGGLKNLRCFPSCGKAHKERGFCGRSVFVAYSSAIASNNSTLVSWVEFVKYNETPPIKIGEAITYSKAIELERSKAFPKKPWISGDNSTKHPQTCLAKDADLPSPVIFEYNKEHRGWHYSWASNKHSCNLRHALQSYLFEVVSKNSEIAKGIEIVDEKMDSIILKDDLEQLGAKPYIPSITPNPNEILILRGLARSPIFMLFCRRRKRFKVKPTAPISKPNALLSKRRKLKAEKNISNQKKTSKKNEDDDESYESENYISEDSNENLEEDIFENEYDLFNTKTRSTIKNIGQYLPVHSSDNREIEQEINFITLMKRIASVFIQTSANEKEIVLSNHKSSNQSIEEITSQFTYNLLNLTQCEKHEDILSFCNDSIASKVSSNFYSKNNFNVQSTSKRIKSSSFSTNISDVDFEAFQYTFADFDDSISRGYPNISSTETNSFDDDFKKNGVNLHPLTPIDEFSRNPFIDKFYIIRELAKFLIYENKFIEEAQKLVLQSPSNSYDEFLQMISNSIKKFMIKHGLNHEELQNILNIKESKNKWVHIDDGSCSDITQSKSEKYRYSDDTKTIYSSEDIDFELDDIEIVT